MEYEYTAEQPDELTIKKGDIITDVVQKLDGKRMTEFFLMIYAYFVLM